MLATWFEPQNTNGIKKLMNGPSVDTSDKEEDRKWGGEMKYVNRVGTMWGRMAWNENIWKKIGEACTQMWAESPLLLCKSIQHLLLNLIQ